MDGTPRVANSHQVRSQAPGCDGWISRTTGVPMRGPGAGAGRPASHPGPTHPSGAAWTAQATDAAPSPHADAATIHARTAGDGRVAARAAAATRANGAD